MHETGFTKLFSSLITSTIWQEDDRTRIVWITMIAIANRYGEVGGTAPGISRLAGVPLKATEKAIIKLESPDELSRDQEFEGRRIERIDGGYQILNYAKYRNKMRSRADYMKDYRNGKIYGTKPSNQANNEDVTPCNTCNTSNRAQPIAEAEAEAEAEAKFLSLKRKKHKYMDFVFLSLEEHQKLINRFGEQGTVDRIAALNDYIGAKGKKYKSHYYTLLTWERLHPQPKQETAEERLKRLKEKGLI